MEAKEVGTTAPLFMGDCGVIPNPDSEQLADIAITTASLAFHLTGARPKVAMLSYSTHGNARHQGIAKIQRRRPLLKKKPDN